MNSEPGTRSNRTPNNILAAQTMPIPSGSNKSAVLKVSSNSGFLGKEKFFSGLEAKMECGRFP
jgi:hypothetical protein